MGRLGFKGKILLPVAALIFILLVATILLQPSRFIGFSKTMMHYRPETAASGASGARNIPEEKQ